MPAFVFLEHCLYARNVSALQRDPPWRAAHLAKSQIISDRAPTCLHNWSEYFLSRHSYETVIGDILLVSSMNSDPVKIQALHIKIK